MVFHNGIPQLIKGLFMENILWLNAMNFNTLIIKAHKRRFDKAIGLFGNLSILTVITAKEHALFLNLFAVSKSNATKSKHRTPFKIYI